jgi:hypothetical protein
MVGNSDYTSILTYLRLILVIILALGTTLLVDNELIVKIFVKVVIFLAGISLILFYSKFIESYASFFPVIEFHGHQYVNAFVYLFFDSVEKRNLSIFYEPGLYQIYLNIALFVLLYFGKTYRFSSLLVIVLLVAIYSTNSTTGYILSMLVFCGQIFSTSLRNKGILSIVTKVAVVVFAIFLIVLSNVYSTNIEEKFFGDKHKSFESRKNSSTIDYLIISESPLIGTGAGSYQGLLNYYDNSGLTIDSSSNTFSQLGALVGLPFVILLFWRFWVYVSKLETGFVVKCISMSVYIISFSTQSFLYYPLFYLPVFMSYHVWRVGQRVSD